MGKAAQVFQTAIVSGVLTYALWVIAESQTEKNIQRVKESGFKTSSNDSTRTGHIIRAAAMTDAPLYKMSKKEIDSIMAKHREK